MSIRTHRLLVTSLVLGGVCLLLFGAGDNPVAQTPLPKIEVEKPKQAAAAR